MERIIEYIKKNKVLLSICAIFALMIVILGIILHKTQQNKSIAEVNLKAATEEMQVLKTKNGDLLVEKQSYVTTIKELEGKLDISEKEVTDLQKSLNNKILYISELESEINIKPSTIHDTTVVYKDSTMYFAFKFGDEWYSLTGNSEVSKNIAKTKIDNISVNVPLKVGLTDDWQLFATTSNPYVSISNIEGALLDKDVYLKQQKTKHWGIGVYGGFNIGYDLIHKGFYAGPGIGAGISYIF